MSIEIEEAPAVTEGDAPENSRFIGLVCDLGEPFWPGYVRQAVVPGKMIEFRVPNDVSRDQVLNAHPCPGCNGQCGAFYFAVVGARAYDFHGNIKGEISLPPEALQPGTSIMLFVVP